MDKNNITFIGMAGCGKSFLGKQIAKKLGYKFLDTDDIIEEQNNIKLKEIIDKLGEDKFLAMEMETVLNLKNIGNCVISPGGSLVYSPKAMEFLKKISTVIFLDAPFEIVEKRIQNTKERGVIRAKNKTLKQLYNERKILYKNYADETLEINENYKAEDLLTFIKKMENITFDEFKKLDIRIGKILSAEKVEGSDKLLKLEVDFGQDKRQIIAGIAQFYAPEALVGKECPFAYNLAPRTLKGLESQGMILCPSDTAGPVLLHPDKEVPPGSLIK